MGGAGELGLLFCLGLEGEPPPRRPLWWGFSPTLPLGGFWTKEHAHPPFPGGWRPPHSDVLSPSSFLRWFARSSLSLVGEEACFGRRL